LTKASNAEHAPRVPRLRTDCDVRSLPITPRDAFLLSRVDGATNEIDIASMTGSDVEAVRAGIDRLVMLGALELPGVEAARPPPVQPTANPSHNLGRRTSQTQMKSVAEIAAALDEPTDLDADRKRRVLDLFTNLADRDFYVLLGVSSTAEKREVKRAYYALAPDFHPDKFFGKNLGSFKAKMEAIFAQLTYAYETLSSLDRRAEYDAYLALQRETRSMEELLNQAPVQPAAGYESGSERVGTPASPPEAKPPTSMRNLPASGSTRETSSVPPDPTSQRSPQDERARRLALARKLGVTRSSAPPESRHSAPPSSVSGGSAAAAAAAAQELKRLRDASIDQGRRSHVRKYVESAEAQLKDNPAAAANAYRLALTIEPNNPDIIKGHEEASKLAAVALAGGYLKQAQYEARSGHWREAARSFTRAAAGMPNDPAVLQQAAHALLKAAADLRQAADFAKRAVAEAPKILDARLTLIEVYLAAGMPLAARRELDAARELGPRDDRIVELTKRMR
jgi:curved DNA-binding protein CbpA